MCSSICALYMELASKFTLSRVYVYYNFATNLYKLPTFKLTLLVTVHGTAHDVIINLQFGLAISLSQLATTCSFN